MRDRIEGATLPGYTATVTADNGAVITDGASYTWQCEASLRKDRNRIWNKTDGITPAASGFTVVWAAGDVGALAAGDNLTGTAYVLEFTGTNGTQIIKHHETVVIRPEVAAAS